MNIPTLYVCDENFGFRKLARGDLRLLSELKAETWGNTHTGTIVNEEDQDRWFDSMQTDVNQPDKLFLTMVQREGKEKDVVGFFKLANIDYINRCADAGWDLMPDYRGMGIGKIIVKGGASFSFNFLNLRRLTADSSERLCMSGKSMTKTTVLRPLVVTMSTVKCGGCCVTNKYWFMYSHLLDCSNTALSCF